MISLLRLKFSFIFQIRHFRKLSLMNSVYYLTLVKFYVYITRRILIHISIGLAESLANHTCEMQPFPQENFSTNCICTHIHVCTCPKRENSNFYSRRRMQICVGAGALARQSVLQCIKVSKCNRTDFSLYPPNKMHARQCR